MTAKSIDVLLAEAGKKIGAIDKGSRNASQGYSFRGIDTVMDKVGPVFHELGIVCTPNYTIHSIDSYETRNGTVMREVMLSAAFTFRGPAGDSTTTVTIGQGVDSGDKAANKAMAVALKYALLQTLMIPVGDGDPDSESPEPARRAGKAAGSTSATPSGPAAAGNCPSCGSFVDDKRATATGKQPKWVCSNSDCQGGRPRSNNPAEGRYGWSSWDSWPKEWPQDEAPL